MNQMQLYVIYDYSGDRDAKEFQLPRAAKKAKLLEMPARPKIGSKETP